MATLDTFIVVFIVVFLALLIWSRVMDQSMLDTVVEIKDMVTEIKK